MSQIAETRSTSYRRRALDFDSHRFRVFHQLPRALRALAHEAAVTEDEPHPTIRVEPTVQPGTGVILDGPCHKRAIHSSHYRSRADNHGQRHGDRHLRGYPPSQVMILPDLALGAGSHSRQGQYQLAHPAGPHPEPGRGTGSAGVLSDPTDRRGRPSSLASKAQTGPLAQACAEPIMISQSGHHWM